MFLRIRNAKVWSSTLFTGTRRKVARLQAADETQRAQAPPGLFALQRLAPAQPAAPRTDNHDVTLVSSVGSVGPTAFAPSPQDGPLSVAAALRTLRLRPGTTVAVSDSAENIQRNFDALQAVAARVSSLSASDGAQTLTVTAAQYARGGAVLQKWAAGVGNTVEVSGVSAATAGAMIAGKPSWVSSITVADTAANLQRRLDDLQTLATGGSLRQIVQTGPATALRMSAAQLASRSDALALFRNQAYTLAITDASVAQTLGLNGQAALTANSRVRSIDVKDTTEAIENNLDGLQRMGLRLKSISRTGEDSSLTITGEQYAKNAIVLGKIVTPFQLDVIRASAAQSARLAADRKVITVSLDDTAANLGRSWSLIQRLSDSLSGMQVRDAANAITVSSEQLALSERMLARLNAIDGMSYKLNVTGVGADQAADVAALDRVASVTVRDSADSIAGALAGLAGSGKLQGIVLTGPARTLAIDASRLVGSAAAATQTVLDRISGGSFGVAARGATMDMLSDLAANTRVTAVEFGGTSAEIASNIETLARLGRRVSVIRQSDAGEAITLSQSSFEGRAGLLGRIEGGYRVNLTGATAGKALAAALNPNVARISVTDTGRSIAASWSALRSLGSLLQGVTETDAGAIALSAADYIAGKADGLTGKLDAAQRFVVQGADVDDAMAIAADDQVERIEITTTGSTVAERLADLDSLRGSGKVSSMSLRAGATNVRVRADQLNGAQGVLDMISGGRYTLSVDRVDVAAAAQLALNGKVTSMQVRGDAAGIAENLASLSALGQRLAAIERTDGTATALTLTGAAFEQQQTTLAKIAGGFAVELSQVEASRAATLAANARVRSLQVSDAAERLSAAWNSLDGIGTRLAGIEQTHASPVQLSMAQWSTGASLAGKWTTPFAASVSGARVSDLAALAANGAVQRIQVSDDAATIAQAWGDLAAQEKLTQLTISDPGTAMSMSGASFKASTDLLGRISGGQYKVTLTDVDAADVSLLGANSRVSSMDVTGAAGDVAPNFGSLNALGRTGRLGSITLSEDGSTLTLAAAQVREGTSTLAQITSAYRIAATSVALADVADIQAVPEVATIAVRDSASNVSDRFSELVGMGALVNGLGLTDAQPVLSLTQQQRTEGAALLARTTGSWAIDLSGASAADVETLDADPTLRQIGVSDSAARIAGNWSALVASYAEGAGKLTSLNVDGDEMLMLTQAQQLEGASMIAALLSDRTIGTMA